MDKACENWQDRRKQDARRSWRTQPPRVARRFSRWWQQISGKGIRASLKYWFVCTILVFVFNLFAFTWAISNHKYGHGSRTIYRGRCDKAKRIASEIQLGINFLSMLLLASSNYCMQCVGAPSRDEVNQAHSKKVTLQLGLPTLKNIFWIDRCRAFLWLILGLVAVQIHFFYNSTVFLRMQANEYNVTAGPTSFLDADFNASQYYDFGPNNSRIVPDALDMKARIQAGRFEKLDVQNCIKSYSQQYISRWGDLLLIQDGDHLASDYFDQQRAAAEEAFESVLESRVDVQIDTGAPYLDTNQYTVAPLGRISDVSGLVTYPLTSTPYAYPSSFWQCLGLESSDDRAYCNQTTMQQFTPQGVPHAKWAPFGNDVQHCWAEKAEEKCSLVVELGTSVAVLVCNLIIICNICFTFYWMRTKTLITIGDAVESFLNSPDSETAGLCTYSSATLNLKWSLEKLATSWGPILGEDRFKRALAKLQKPWKPKRLRWWRSASPSRYICFIL